MPGPRVLSGRRGYLNGSRKSCDRTMQSQSLDCDTHGDREGKGAPARSVNASRPARTTAHNAGQRRGSASASASASASDSDSDSDRDSNSDRGRINPDIALDLGLHIDINASPTLHHRHQQQQQQQQQLSIENRIVQASCSASQLHRHSAPPPHATDTPEPRTESCPRTQSSRLSAMLGSVVPAQSSQAISRISSNFKLRLSAIFDTEAAVSRALLYRHPMLLERGYLLRYQLGSGGQGVVVRALYQPNASNVPADSTTNVTHDNSTQHQCRHGQHQHNLPHEIDEVAIKIVPIANATPRQIKELRAEIRILSSMDPHPNVMQYYESFENEEYCYIVTELLTGGDLLQNLLRHGKPIPEQQAVETILQVLNATVFLHSRQISHRDFKLENLVWSQHPLSSPHAVVKLVDFGLAYQRSPGAPLLVSDFPGTSNYESPELILRRPHIPEQNDIWCLGICLWCMLTGHFPFSGRDRRALRDSIVQDNPAYVGSTWKPISAKTRALLSLFLSKDADFRPTALEAKHYLEEVVASLSTTPRIRSVDRLSTRRMSTKIRRALANLKIPNRMQRR